MTDLASFLASRADDDEARAEDMEHEPDTDDAYFNCPATRLGPLGDLPYGAENCDCALAARKARALREVAATRALLVLHKTEVAKREIYPFDPHTGERNPDEYEVTCEICGWVSDDPASACPTLRHLAAIWNDHPGYRQEWAP